MVLALAIDPFAQQIVVYPLRAEPADTAATIKYARDYSGNSDWGTCH